MVVNVTSFYIYIILLRQDSNFSFIISHQELQLSCQFMYLTEKKRKNTIKYPPLFLRASLLLYNRLLRKNHPPVTPSIVRDAIKQPEAGYYLRSEISNRTANLVTVSRNNDRRIKELEDPISQRVHPIQCIKNVLCSNVAGKEGTSFSPRTMEEDTRFLRDVTRFMITEVRERRWTSILILVTTS